MSVKECYKNYKNLKDEAKRMKKKFGKVRRSMSKVVSYFDEPNDEICFKLVVDYWDLGPLLHVCPNFDQAVLDDWAQCENCKFLSNRLHYEFYKKECIRIDKEKNQAKQELLCAIKKSMTRGR